MPTTRTEGTGARRAGKVEGYPAVPGSALLARTFAAAARLRGARVFHPNGVLLDGEWEAYPDGPLAGAGARAAVTVRLSKGAGLPARVPDILGCAVRVHAEEGPWDLTLASAGAGPLGRIALRPATSWSGAWYSSLAPYQAPGGLTWLLARFDVRQRADEASLDAPARFLRRNPLTLTVTAVRGFDDRCPAGRLRLDRVRPDQARPAFDPMGCPPPGWWLFPRWLSGLREMAYRGSQVGRERGEVGRERG
jgi:hypothetical protein